MKNKLVQRINDLWATQYLNGEKVPKWYRALLRYSPTREDVALHFAKQNRGQLLDVGCGEGKLIAKLSGNYKKIIGIDLVDYRVQRGMKILKMKKINNVFLEVGNIEDGLEFRSGVFDVAVCLSVIEYTFDPYFSVNEISRVLKKHGILILSVPNVGFVGERLGLLFGKLPNVANAPGWQGGRLHNFTESSLRKLLENEGFKINKVVGSGFLNKIRSVWPSLLCGDLIFICRKE